MRRFNLLLVLWCLAWPGLALAVEDYSLNVNGVAANQYGEAVQEEEGVTVLMPGVERTGALRRLHQFRTFMYEGQKDETLTVRVESVQFAPEVFLRDAGDGAVAEEFNRDGAHDLKMKTTLSAAGEYKIRVRAKGAGQGVFRVTVESEMPKPAVQPSTTKASKEPAAK
ncbi:MAG: hypothetical protein HGA80_05725 [Candidatus Omnitrophica bacterium]|nr:hypothetical protein [Candidatus Omnitrophota bacterium]